MFVRLFRDSFETPWGFRLQGGKDIGHALTVQRVFSNSPAEGELQRGDVILSINGRDANTFTHKQALDTIKFGGGQIELKVNRPAPGNISLKTLQPTSPTRAPQINPTKPSPLKFPVRRASDQGPRDMPPPAVAGFQPKKITLNKYGGGTTNFGSNYGARAQQPGWRPQPSPYSQQYTPQPSMQEQYGSNYQQYQPQQYQPPSPQYQPPSPQYQPPSPQYQAPSPQFQPQPPQPEPYLPKYQSPGLSQPDYVRSEDPVDEEEYDYVPVSQRKQQFAEKKGAPAAIKSRKAKPFVPASGGGQSFGTDYSKSRPQPPQPPVQQQRPRPPPVAQKPVNAAPVAVDQPDTSSSSTVWSGTLRSSGGPRPWEQENVGEYIMPSQRETLQQSPPGRPAPAVSPKPTRPQPQPQPQPQPKPSQAPPSPQKQIIVRTSSTVSKPKTPQPGIAHAGRYDCPNVVYSKEMIDPNPRTHSLATDFSYQGDMYPSPIVDQPSGHYVPHYQMQMYPYEVDNIEYKPTYRPVKPPVPSFVAKDAPPLRTVENEINKKPEVETNEIPQIGQDVEKVTKTENVSDHKTEESVSNSSKDAATMEPAEPQDSSLKDEKDAPISDDTKNDEEKVPEQTDEKQAHNKPTDSKASTESGTDESSKTSVENEKSANSIQNVVPEDKAESQVHEKPADENEKAESTKEDVPGDKVSSEKNPECQGNETSVSSEGGAKEEHVAEPSSMDDAKKDAVLENEISISDTKETPTPENDTSKPNKTEETKEKSSMDNPDDSVALETKDQGTEETTKPETTAENVPENVSEKDNTTDTSPQTQQATETEIKEKEKDLPHKTDGENKKEEVVEKPVSEDQKTTSENEDQKATSENEPTADDPSP